MNQSQIQSSTARVLPADISGRLKYERTLNDAWAAHCAPRASDAPTVISLFAGCGGSSLGYSIAGYRELLAVEFNKHAVETFKANFPDVPVFDKDIATLTSQEVMQLTRLQAGQLDVLDGSPPCQGFSMQGKRIMNDPRNQLFVEYCRLLKELQPKALVMENVMGMVQGKMKLIFVEILQALKATGYKVSARLMNTMYFGVPQSRQRLIFIGVRSDIQQEPSHPRGLQRVVTSGEAIPGLEMSNHSLLDDNEYKEVQLTIKRSFGLRIPNPNKPASTIIAGDNTCHPFEMRRLTASELKRLSSFPDQFQLSGHLSNKIQRIGNAVPPLFMAAIAKHIKEKLLNGR